MKCILKILLYLLLLPLVAISSTEDEYETYRQAEIYTDELVNQNFDFDQIEWEGIVTAAEFAYQRILKAINSLHNHNLKDAIGYLDSALYMTRLLESTIPSFTPESEHALETVFLPSVLISESNNNAVFIDLHLMIAFIKNARSALDMQRTFDALLFLNNALLSSYVETKY